MSRIFRPAWWITLPVFAVCALTASLGVWQYQRGVQKQTLLDSLAMAATQPAVMLQRDSIAGEYPVRAQAQGHYDVAHQVLLDNQTHEQTPGYHVWTPLRLTDGGVLLVNRGWLPANPDRSVLPELPTPKGEVAVRGLWRALPEPGLRLAHATTETEFPAVLTYPDRAQLRQRLGFDVSAGILLLDPGVDGGFVRDWQSTFVGFPPSRHYAYAAQWFALCATLLFLFIKFNLKKSDG